MNNNIDNIVCEAVDIIVQQRLQEVQYDRTLSGEIVGEQQKDGTYKVKYENGIRISEPIDSNIKYKDKDSVYLQICADGRNLIIGTQEKKDGENKIKHENPWDKLLDITGNLWDEAEQIITIPNLNFVKYIDKPLKYAGFSVKITTIGIVEEENNPLDLEDNKYVIQIYKEEDEKDEEEVIINLKSSEIFGNPLRLNMGHLEQEIVTIDNYEFLEGAKYKVRVVIENNDTAVITVDNIKLENIYFCLAYEQTDFDTKDSMLFTYSTNLSPNALYDSNNSEIGFECKLIDYDSETNRYNFKPITDSELFKYHLFYYNIGYTGTIAGLEKNPGTYWQKIGNSGVTIDLKDLANGQAVNRQEASFKAIYGKIESDVIKFYLRGVAEEEEEIPVEANTDISLTITNNGIIQYNPNGSLIEYSNKDYTITVSHVDFTDENNKDKEVMSWYIPIHNTLIEVEEKDIGTFPVTPQEIAANWFIKKENGDYDNTAESLKLCWQWPTETVVEDTSKWIQEDCWIIIDNKYIADLNTVGMTLQAFRELITSNNYPKDKIRLVFKENRHNSNVSFFEQYYIISNYSSNGEFFPAEKSMTFTPASSYLSGKTNNVIYFSGSKGNILYNEKIFLQFEKVSNSGTEYSLSIYFKEGYNKYIVRDSELEDEIFTKPYGIEDEEYFNKSNPNNPPNSTTLGLKVVQTETGEIIDLTNDNGLNTVKWSLLYNQDDQKRFLYPFNNISSISFNTINETEEELEKPYEFNYPSPPTYNDVTGQNELIISYVNGGIYAVKDNKLYYNSVLEKYTVLNKTKEKAVSRDFINNLVISASVSLKLSNGTTRTLIAYLPIPVVNKKYLDDYLENFSHLVGPIEILYDHTSSIASKDYSSIPYELFLQDENATNTKEESYSLIYRNQSNLSERNKTDETAPFYLQEQINDYYPEPPPDIIEGEEISIPPKYKSQYNIKVPTYLPKDNYMYTLEISKVNLTWEKEGNYEYVTNKEIDSEVAISFPIFYLQNKYFSSVINEWDGEKTVVDDHYVLSTMVGAGTKNNENAFSGVVMGQIKHDTDSNKTKMGLFGFNEGTSTFVLDSDDGSAWFKNSLTIGEPNNANGYITLEDGSIVIKTMVNNEEKDLILINQDNQFQINQQFIVNIDENIKFTIEEKVYEITTNGNVLFGCNTSIPLENFGAIYIDATQGVIKSFESIAYLQGINLNINYSLNEDITNSLNIGNIIMPDLKDPLILKYYPDKVWGDGIVSNGGAGLRIIARGNEKCNNPFLLLQAGKSFKWDVKQQETNTYIDVFPIATIKLYNNQIGFFGTQYSSAPASTSSDLNKKSKISLLTNNYSILFDKLKPITYKYRDGTSDRLHVGFIAQQVKEALDMANLSTQEFAGLIISEKDTINESWYLRYEEFIALNTHEIQKLKARVAELEAQLEKKEK